MKMCDSNIEECPYRLPCGICTYRDLDEQFHEPAIRRRAQWEFKKIEGGLGYFRCTNCGYVTYERTPCCESCGAEMEVDDGIKTV